MLRSPAALALLLAAGCVADPPRGYYRPAGAPPQETLAAWIEQGPDRLVEARCQGVYANEVDGLRTSTAHVQLDVARTCSGDLSMPRDSLQLELFPAGGGEPLRLSVSEVFSGRHHVHGDLVTPGWTRRPFDLFFDAPELLADGPPAVLRLAWELRDGEHSHAGGCEWTRIPDDDPFSPGRLPPADPSFGLRDGYYLPGVRLSDRRVRSSGEERQHYLYHEAEGWWW